eukprot:TRINITY_DN75647_c0_g1_i1.p1 TRINITY_DN75647_c0_g1~~TRINITY_DN75647_c0_g1_i1.p1  ORF type:complete len:123 (-),score=29.24 TRINITY_DN75647_c0_g1_i1:48-416(-)
MSESEEETGEVLDPMAKALAGLPPVHVRKMEMREDLFDKTKIISCEALKTHKLQKDVAQHIKQELDKDMEFNELIGKGPWQVIVGRSFACAFTHEAMHLAFFDIPKYQETVMIFKSLGVQSI